MDLRARGRTYTADPFRVNAGIDLNPRTARPAADPERMRQANVGIPLDRYSITCHRARVTSTLFASIATAGFVFAFLHAAMPTHWLPFVLVGRGQKWSARKTLGVAGLAALGHVVVTVLAGLILTAIGLQIGPRLGGVFPWLVGGGVVLLGFFYIGRHLLAPAPHRIKVEGYRSDRAAIVGLVTLLAIAPSEFLGVYTSNMVHGWTGFVLLSVVLAVGTSLGMLLFTGLSLAGANRLKLAALDRYESLIVGIALVVLGIAVIAFKP